MNTGARIVHVVDDEAGMRKALTRLLRAEGFAVRAFASAGEFLADYRAEESGCLVLDVAMPELDGLELQRRLTHAGVLLPIVFLTGHGDIPMSVRAIKSGAVDFLTKPVNDADLLRAIRTALALAASRSTEQSRFVTLTPREREVMAHVVAGKLNKQIAADLGTGEQNIKIHRGRVMEKMGVQSLADLVRAAERLRSGGFQPPNARAAHPSNPHPAQPPMTTLDDHAGRLEAAPPRFFDPHAEIRRTQNRLPHWQQEHATYFITFHLGDSVPRALLDRWREEREAWLRWNPPPHSPPHENEYHERFARPTDQWLDAGHGACVLRRPECAAVVAEALRHFEGVRYRHFAWVVMPNHVHTLLAPVPPWTIEQILHSWKSFTSSQINKIVNRTGPLWQRDSFDRLVRDARHFARCVRYIRGNAPKAKLKPDEYVSYESPDVDVE